MFCAGLILEQTFDRKDLDGFLLGAMMSARQ